MFYFHNIQNVFCFDSQNIEYCGGSYWFMDLWITYQQWWRVLPHKHCAVSLHTLWETGSLGWIYLKPLHCFHCKIQEKLLCINFLLKNIHVYWYKQHLTFIKLDLRMIWFLLWQNLNFTQNIIYKDSYGHSWKVFTVDSLFYLST